MTTTSQIMQNGRFLLSQPKKAYFKILKFSRSTRSNVFPWIKRLDLIGKKYFFLLLIWFLPIYIVFEPTDILTKQRFVRESTQAGNIVTISQFKYFEAYTSIPVPDIIYIKSWIFISQTEKFWLSKPQNIHLCIRSLDWPPVYFL